MFRPKTAKKATDPNQCIAARCEEPSMVTPEQQAAYGCPPLCQAHGQEWEAAGRPSLEDMRKRPPRAGDKGHPADSMNAAQAEPEPDPQTRAVAVTPPKPEKKARAKAGGPSDLEKQLSERGPQLTASLAFLQAANEPPAWFEAALKTIAEQRDAYSKWLEAETFTEQERHKAAIEKLGAMFRPLLDTLDACEKLCRSRLPAAPEYAWRIVTPSKLPAQFVGSEGPYMDMIDLYVRSRGAEAAAQIGVEVIG